MDKRDSATIAPAPPDCIDCRDQVILANLTGSTRMGITSVASSSTQMAGVASRSGCSTRPD